MLLIVKVGQFWDFQWEWVRMYLVLYKIFWERSNQRLLIWSKSGMVIRMTGIKCWLDDWTRIERIVKWNEWKFDIFIWGMILKFFWTSILWYRQNWLKRVCPWYLGTITLLLNYFWRQLDYSTMRYYEKLTKFDKIFMH